MLQCVVLGASSWLYLHVCMRIPLRPKSMVLPSKCQFVEGTFAALVLDFPSFKLLWLLLTIYCPIIIINQQFMHNDRLTINYPYQPFAGQEKID